MQALEEDTDVQVPDVSAAASKRQLLEPHLQHGVAPKPGQRLEHHSRPPPRHSLRSAEFEMYDQNTLA